MEHHGGHPLLHGGHHLEPAAALAYAWDPPLVAPFDHVADDEQLECFSTASELRQALLRSVAELDAARAAHQAELRRMGCEAARLAALLASVSAERDDLRRHCHYLLLLLQHQSQSPPSQRLPAAQVPTAHAAVLGGGAGAVDEHAPDAAATSEEAKMEMALTRRLPEKGRLVEAVVSAGPLLQTLLLAGPLPRWRHPPPPAGGADIPPFNPGRPSPNKAGPEAAKNSFSSSSAASSSPESNCSGGSAPLVTQQALPYHMSSFCT